MKSKKNQFNCGRRNGGRKSHIFFHKSTIFYLCIACFVCTLILISLDYHGLLKLGLLITKKINVVLLRCVKLSNQNVKKFSKTCSGGHFLSFLANQEKFMCYVPHSGFNNQVMEFKNSLLFAKILNRTLIIPPILDHHTTWLGNCPKRRILSPHHLRVLVWTRIFDLVSNSSARYTSIADIIDISSITPSKVKTIDLRVFLALWCGIDISASCGGTLCKTFAKKVFVWNDYATCIQMINPMPPSESNCCVYGVENDCTSTIWTYNPKLRNYNGTMELQKDNHRNWGSSCCTAANMTKPHKLQNMRHQASEKISNQYDWKAEKVKMTKIVMEDIGVSLGANSAASRFPVIAFGSMFSTLYKNAQSYINITEPSGDKDMDDLIRSLKLLSFSSEILAAARIYIDEEIAHPAYFCAQIRLSDGQFKNHRNATIGKLRAQLKSLRTSHGSRTPIFVMTDLPNENWTKAMLKDLLQESGNPYQVHMKLFPRNDLIESASKRILTGEAGFAVGSIAGFERGFQKHQSEQLPVHAEFNIPHVELAIEEVVCSCARLGFFGTQGSTIADSIRDLRTIDICNTD